MKGKRLHKPWPVYSAAGIQLLLVVLKLLNVLLYPWWAILFLAEGTVITILILIIFILLTK